MLDPRRLSLVDDAIQQSRLRSAEKMYEQAIEHADEEPLKTFLIFNLGALYWGEIGDGARARAKFKDVVARYDASSVIRTAEAKFPLAANSCENLMLLSLSYQEFNQWAQRLLALAPSSEVLNQLVPVIKEIEESGKGWYEAMQVIASTYHTHQTRYASMVCILKLLIENRKELRVPREQWRLAVLSFGGAVIKVLSENRLRMSRSGKIEYDEFLFIGQDALPVIRQYAETDPADTKIRELLANLETLVTQFTGQIEPTLAPTGQQAAMAKSARPACVVVGLFAGLLAGVFGFTMAPAPWDLVSGAVLGIWGGYVIGGYIDFFRKGRSPQQLAWQTSSELKRAIANQGLDGLSFELVDVREEIDVSLGLLFVPAQNVPDSKITEAHYALRSVVGLTFPAVASCVPEFRVFGDDHLGYNVRLGAGVPLSAWVIQMGNARYGPLQVTSEEDDGKYYVYVAPFVRPMIAQSLTRPEQNNHPDSPFVHRLVSAFEPLKALPLTFNK